MDRPSALRSHDQSWEAPSTERSRHMFKPGQSGNPGGRPKSATAIRSRALEMTPELLEREICNRALGLPVAVNADLDQMKE